MSDKFILNQEPIKVRLNIHPKANEGFESFVTHTFKRPTFAEEETRERMMASITKQGAKIEGTTAIIQEFDDTKANVSLYNKVAKSVEGYKLPDGSKEDTPVSKEFQVKEETKKVLDLIPDAHKNTAIYGIFNSAFEIDAPEDDFEFSLGAGREWKIIQKIGGQARREDGTLSEPDYVVRYILTEPSEKDRKTFRDKATSSQRYSSREGVVERSSLNLRVLAELFDKLVLSVEDALVADENGETSVIDVRKKEHLDLIPASYKKTVIIRLFNSLEADLGN